MVLAGLSWLRKGFVGEYVVITVKVAAGWGVTPCSLVWRYVCT
jgi:hypothetical protein